MEVIAGLWTAPLSLMLNVRSTQKDTVKSPLKVMGFGCAGLTVIAIVLVGAVLLIGSIAPDTSVYPGRQVPKRFMTTIRSLYLLEEGEQIRYFYSDALWDIKEGMYFVTDKNLVLYINSLEEPSTIIPLAEVQSVEAEYNDSFFMDSAVFVRTITGIEVTFPVSSEKGLDKKFVQAIQEKVKVEPGATDNPDSGGF